MVLSELLQQATVQRSVVIGAELAIHHRKPDYVALVDGGTMGYKFTNGLLSRFIHENDPVLPPQLGQ
jgi:hypothetical protein